MGPVQILLLGFGDVRTASTLADELGALSAAGTIRVVDARLLVRESAHEVIAIRLSEVEHTEREDLRAVAYAFAGLGEIAALESDYEERPILEADAALDVAELGMCEAEVTELAEELEVGDALLLLVIENVWAAGFATALREVGGVFAQQDYLSSDGLVALGAMLDLEVAIDS